MIVDVSENGKCVSLAGGTVPNGDNMFMLT